MSVSSNRMALICAACIRSIPSLEVAAAMYTPAPRAPLRVPLRAPRAPSRTPRAHSIQAVRRGRQRAAGARRPRRQPRSARRPRLLSAASALSCVPESSRYRSAAEKRRPAQSCCFASAASSWLARSRAASTRAARRPEPLACVHGDVAIVIDTHTANRNNARYIYRIGAAASGYMYCRCRAVGV